MTLRTGRQSRENIHTAKPWKNAPDLPTSKFLQDLWTDILDVTLNEYTPEFGRSADFSVCRA